MISQKTPLFFEKIKIFENFFDYFDHKTFMIYYHHSILDVPVNIAQFKLVGLWIVKKGIPKMKTTIKFEKDLVKFFAIENTYTKNKKFIVFDEKIAFHTPKRCNLIMTNK